MKQRKGEVTLKTDSEESKRAVQGEERESDQGEEGENMVTGEQLSSIIQKNVTSIESCKSAFKI